IGSLLPNTGARQKQLTVKAAMANRAATTAGPKRPKRIEAIVASLNAPMNMASTAPHVAAPAAVPSYNRPITLRVAVIVLAGCSLVGCSAIAGCGLERWPVKDALDHDARQIDLTPRDSTIAELTALPAPPMPSRRYDTRYAPVETTVYRISATLVHISYTQD